MVERAYYGLENSLAHGWFSENSSLDEILGQRMHTKGLILGSWCKHRKPKGVCYHIFIKVEKIWEIRALNFFLINQLQKYSQKYLSLIHISEPTRPSP